MKKLKYYFIAGFLLLLFLSFGGAYLLRQQMAEGDWRLEVYTEGQLYRTVNLTEGKTEEIKVINAAGHYNVVEIEAGRARVREADCHNQVCVNTGWVSEPGQIAVCAPNKCNIVVKGKGNDIDAISY